MDYFRTDDGANLAFKYAKGNAPPFVFVHGAYIAANEWQPQLSALEGKSHLLLDLRGHGHSDKKGFPYSVVQFADDVVQLIRHLGLTDVSLCGHSLGGMVAQQLAVESPELVSKLILADTSYGVRLTRLESFLTDVTLPLFNLAPIAWQTALFANQIGKYSAETKRYVKDEIGQHAENPENYHEVWRAVTQFDGYAQLSEIKCPTLIMVGELNRQTHPQAQVMKTRIHDSELVFIENAGHMLNWDNPEQFNRALLSFIGR